MDPELVAVACSASSYQWADEVPCPDDDLRYIDSMDYPRQINLDEEQDFSETPILTTSCSTATNSTNVSESYAHTLPNIVYPSRSFPSAFPWSNLYSELNPPLLKHEVYDQPIIQGGIDEICQEPQTYVDGFGNPTSMVSSSASFAENGHHQYQSGPSVATWPNIQSSVSAWSATDLESKNSGQWLARNTSSITTTTDTQGMLQSEEKVKCDVEGCDKTFARTADLKRHMKTLHGKSTFSCGCCDESQRRLVFKRKDKLLKHKRIFHAYSEDGSSLKTCPHKDCLAGEDKVMFCTDAALERHIHKAHHSDRIGLPNIQDSPAAGKQNTLSSYSGELSNATIPGHSTTTSKRQHQDDPTDNSKRPKVEQYHDQLARASEKVTSLGNLDFTAIPRNGIDTLSYNDTNDVEVLPASSQSSDLFLISQLNSGLRSGSAAVRSLVSRLEKLDISFDLSKRSVKLHGCHEETMRNITPELRILLNRQISNDRRPPHLAPSDELICLSNDRMDRLIMSCGPVSKTFVMRKDDDKIFLKVWHNDVLPSLPGILVQAIGVNYSATLVRKGESESQSHAVIQIQCPKIPSPRVRAYIRTQILKPIVGKIISPIVRVEFMSGSLALLAGEANFDLNQCQDEEDSESYPYFKRYWARPGMGASIGLSCTDKVSATLGCFINVDDGLYMLTVNHFIPKSHKSLLSEEEPTLHVSSPPPSEIKETRDLIEQVVRDISHEVRNIWMETIGHHNLNLSEALSPPPEVDYLLQKLEFAGDDLTDLNRDAGDFRLGEVLHQSGPPVALTEQATVGGGGIGDVDVDIHSAATEAQHHMDWALCSVVPNREGLNRHRYEYDYETREIDYVNGDVGMFGAGKLCVETGFLEPGAEVHFVGQSSGLIHGTINPALSQVSTDGICSTEWTMVVKDSQQTSSAHFHGDSGASVLQNNNNNLVGHLWGSVKDSLVIAPITAIFNDIRRKLNARSICLPPAYHPKEVKLICRDKTTEIQKSPRRINHSKMQIPKPRTLPNMASVTSNSSSTQLDHQIKHILDIQNKLSLKFILAPQYPEWPAKKQNSFPVVKQSKLDPFKLRRSAGTWPKNTTGTRSMSAISVS